MTPRPASRILAVAAVALAACGAGDAPRTFAVGEHRVSVRVPGGWEVREQGRAVRLRSAGVELVLQDLGPAGPLGIRREAERAQDLWRAGRVDEARWRLANVPLPPWRFANAVEERALRTMWFNLAGESSRALPYDAAAPRLVEVLAAVARLPERTLPELADAGLATLGHDERRDVKARAPVTVGGNEALDVETWTRLAHTSPRRYVFVRNDDFLLALYTATDADAGAVKTLVAVRDSLQFPPAAASDRR